MKLIIAGSRYVPEGVADLLVREAVAAYSLSPTNVIHGGAKGIDQAAGRVFANICQVTCVKADWNLYGKSAGPIRNRQMASMGDTLLAIWDGTSPGTASMIKCAKEKGLRVLQYTFDKNDITPPSRGC